MTTDIVGLGIKVDTSGVSAADAALARLTKAALDASSAINKMSAAHTTLGTAARGAAAAHGAHAAAMGNSRMAMMELEHVTRSMIDGLAAGISPMRLLMMEGSRLAQAYQMAGGAAGVMSIFGSVVSKLMSPTVLLTGAVVGLGAAGFAAFNAWENRLNALQTALNGLGRSTGLTLGGLNQLATSSAGGRTSSSQAAEAITAFAATGKISPAMMGQLTATQSGQSQGLVQQFSQATGESYSDSLKKLAADFADPTKGAAELNKQFGLLGDNQMQLITHLDASGDRLGAQGALLDALSNRIKNAADVTSIWARAWGGVSTAASAALAAAGNAIAPTLEAELSALAAKNRAASGPNIEYGNLRRSANPADMARERTLRQIVARNQQAAYFQGIDQVATEKSRDIGDITRRTIPDIGARQGLLDERNRLQEGINTPGALSKTDAAAAQEALDRLNARLANFATSAQKVAQDSMFASQAIEAETGTQRTALQAMQAWNDVVRNGGNFALAAAESTAKWNEALAESNKEAEDAVRSANRNASHVGMTPYQRRIAEINERYDDLERRAALTGRGAPAAVMPVAVAAGNGLIRGVNSASSLTTPVPIFGSITDGLDVPTFSGARAPSTVRPANNNAAPGASGGIASTAYANYERGRRTDVGTARNDALVDPLRAANTALDAQNALLAIQANAGNMSSAALQGLLERQKLVNEYTKEGVTDLSAYSSKLDDYAKKAEATAKVQEELQQKIQVLDTIRSDANGGLHAFVDDLVAGKNAAFAFKDAMEQLGKKLLSSGLDSVTSILLGKQGTTQTGMLGGLFSSLFHFADGGVMTSAGPIPLRHYAGGGVANSPQAAIFGEGDGPEAFIPLKGGGVPVNIKGGMGGGVTIGGHTIVIQGNADDKAIAQMKAEMAQASKQQMAALQRNLGPMQGRWSQRYSA